MGKKIVHQSTKSVKVFRDSREITPWVSPTVNLHSPFATNKIKTSRYTWWNFLPLAILIQFTKIANVAWLFVMILNSFPAVRVNSPLVVAIVLGIIVFIGVLKEGLTDYARYKLDKKVNNTAVKKLGHLQSGPCRMEAGDKRVVDTKLMDVKVGDVLVLNDKQIIPADCIILATTSENCPEGGEEGFIQTA